MLTWQIFKLLMLGPGLVSMPLIMRSNAVITHRPSVSHSRTVMCFMVMLCGSAIVCFVFSGDVKSCVVLCLFSWEKELSCSTDPHQPAR